MGTAAQLKIVPGDKVIQRIFGDEMIAAQQLARPASMVWTLSVGVWRSLVARLFWVQEVVGSSPAAPTI